MASEEERRFTAAEWADIQARYREQPKQAVRAMYPEPEMECEHSPMSPTSSGKAQHQVGFTPRPHLEEWFSSLSQADVKSLQSLINLRPETIQWVAEKNDRELKQLDGAVEFITSSRTAARVLMWCCGTAVAFIGGVVALTKNGIDMFSIIRGGK